MKRTVSKNIKKGSKKIKKEAKKKLFKEKPDFTEADLEWINRIDAQSITLEDIL